MGKYSKFIVESLNQLLEKRLLQIIAPVMPFNDDPKVFHYNLSAKTTKEITSGRLRSFQASGVSLDSREFALFKSLAETLERLGSNVYSEDTLIKGSYENLLRNKHSAVDPHLFKTVPGIRQKTFKWFASTDVLLQKKILIPAQLVFLNYIYDSEIHLSSEVNTTGCAGGFDHETTLLRGIYELIEREAYLAVFLARLTPKLIDLTTHPDPKIKKILAVCKRYNLELNTVDITNDLQIPTFMSLLFDKTGLGQAFTSGLKSHLNPNMALSGSIEEAFNTRPWYRRNIYAKKNNNKLNSQFVHSHNDRALFWSSPKQIPKISFLFRSKPISWQYAQYNSSSHNQLGHIKNILLNKKFLLYYANITPTNIAPPNYLVYKVFVPQLQPYYIDESAKEIYMERIVEIAKCFGRENFNLNTMPHFFL